MIRIFIRFSLLFQNRKQNYTCRKQNEVSKFVHVVCALRNMAMCRRNLQLKLLKAMVEENDVLNEFYGVIIMRKIQLSKRKHRVWILNIIKKRKRFGVFYHLVKELQLDQNKYLEYFRMSSQQTELVWGFVGPLISKQYRIRENVDVLSTSGNIILRVYETRSVMNRNNKVVSGIFAPCMIPMILKDLFSKFIDRQCSNL